MIEGDKFIVFCEKKPDGETYFVYFAINKQLSDRIKILPKSQRTWNPTNKSWELSAIGLYTVILSYRKSEKIFFNFMGEENKSAFIAQVKKEDETARKSVEDLRRQLEKNDKSIQLKVDLENDYKNHESLILSKLKDGTSLYKHQIIGVCFLEFVNSALLSLEMGLGKTAISIAYAEMRGYDKVFVITPNSLKFNFYNEVAKFTNSRAYIVGSKKTNMN
ncbi:MAG: hypothetical protein HC836_40990 [Richelia sp. RM2_1_2]|nr:hypothetical protein [Richelia sp. RM2_1_2]